jgi:hypothetical protein
MAKVGRFQVMATLQAARALELGLTLDEAKSWGLNRAIFYAAAKRGFRRRGGGTSAEDSGARRGATVADRSRFELGGEVAFLADSDQDPRRFEIGEEPQSPEDFDREIARRFPDWERAWSNAQQIITATPPDDLNSAHRFYEHVYKPRRDELANAWS